MMSPEDFNRDEIERRVQARMDAAKASKGYGRWRSLTPAQRKYFVAALVALLILIAVGIWAYWDVPVVYPSGEGG